MRILLLSWNFPPTIGGIEYVVGHLYEGLLRRKHAVEVITSHAPEAEANPSEVQRASRPGLAAYLLFALRRGITACRRARPDVIVCGSVVPAPVAWLLSRFFRAPFVVLLHGSDLLQPGRLYQRTIRFLLARASRLTANSAQTRDLLETHGFRTGPVDVVHPGVDVQAFARRPEHGATEILNDIGDRPVLLTVGRLVQRKGHLPFIEEAMPRLVEHFPDLLFLIVGDDATRSLVHAERMRDRIAAAIERLGLREHVRLLGTLPNEEDVVALFFRADLFILPCLDTPGDMEGFGIVFLEAALGQTPTVATRVGGIPEAVVDGETGLLTAPGDTDALVEAITRLLRDRDLREKMGAAGERRARTEFSWDNICALYEESFRRCLPPTALRPEDTT